MGIEQLSKKEVMCFLNTRGNYWLVEVYVSDRLVSKAKFDNEQSFRKYIDGCLYLSELGWVIYEQNEALYWSVQAEQDMKVLIQHIDC